MNVKLTLMSTISNALINSLIHPLNNHLLSPNGQDMILDVGDTEINRKSSIILNSLLSSIDHIQINRQLKQQQQKYEMELETA